MIDVVSLKEKVTILAAFPFCRALCEIPLSIPDSAILSKHLSPSDFSGLAGNK